jgi:predicted DsbA family dithiol-disulfide isomerase
MTATAAADGLDFRFDLMRAGNTFDAHRLLHLAKEHDLQDAAKERLMRAYSTEGVAIGDREALARVAAEVLPDDEVRDVLSGERFAEAVRDDEQTAASLGISAVPFFVVDRQIAVSGAQQPELFLALLDRARGAVAS